MEWIFQFFEKNDKKPMGKKDSRFHRDQKNSSRFQIGGTNFRGQVHGGRVLNSLENSKKHL